MKICVFTGTRADYGLLSPLMRRIEADKDTELLVLVSGSHLSQRHGNTVDAILADGFTVHARVPLALEDDTAQGVATAMAEALTGCTEALGRLKPDLLLLLGDRYECIACAAAASLRRIPIAHIHGGELTEGAVDDFYRHAITKMSHLHFTSCEKYRHRVIQLGEQPDTVFNVGALGVENIKNVRLMDKAELEADLEFAMGDACLLVTYHPATLELGQKAQLEEFFSALETLLAENDAITALITGANADRGGSAIDARAARLVETFPKRTMVRPSLGMIRYLSAMKHCVAVVGNSSSGILEAPSLRVPTVNVGNRQKGREQAGSIFNCPAEADTIVKRIKRAMEASTTRVVKEVVNPYEKEGTSRRILEEIKHSIPSTAKTFFDIEYSLPKDKE